MSHVVTMECTFDDPAVIEAAVERIEGATFLGEGSFRLFQTNRKGIGVKLKGWQFPVVIDAQDGKVHFDNYGGAWGNPARLAELTQAYSVAKVRKALRAQGHVVTREERRVDGTVRLVVQGR